MWPRICHAGVVPRRCLSPLVANPPSSSLLALFAARPAITQDVFQGHSTIANNIRTQVLDVRSGQPTSLVVHEIIIEASGDVILPIKTQEEKDL